MIELLSLFLIYIYKLYCHALVFVFSKVHFDFAGGFFITFLSYDGSVRPAFLITNT